MRYRILTLLLALCIFSSGVAMAGFGGSQEETEDIIGDEEELPPVGGWGDEDVDEVDSSIWISEMQLGPGLPDEGVPLGGETVGQTFEMYPWAPSEEEFAPIPAESPIGGYAPTYESTVGAFYTTVAPPAAEQKKLVTYDVSAIPPPTAVYYKGTYMPWSNFAVTFTKQSPTFWVSTSSGWSLYSVCPFHAWVRELMYIPKTGSLKVYEIYSSGQTKVYNYGWASPGYKYIWFYADTPGRHIAIFTVNDVPSNAVTVDVV